MKLGTIVGGVGVVLVIIGMPFLSYMYLREGLSFRINALDALKQDSSELALTNRIKESLDIEKGVVNAIINRSEYEPEMIEELYQKFQGNEFFYFQTFILGDSLGMTSLGDNRKDNVYPREFLNLIDGNDMLLIDTAGMVREVYKNGEDNFKKFVQHLSVLLPVEVSRKVVLER